MENEIVEIEAAAPRFTSEVTHDLPTRKEVNKLYSLLHMGNIFREGLVGAMLCLLFVYLYIYQGNYENYARTYFVFVIAYWGALLFKLIRNRKGGATYKRMLLNNGGKPVHNLITFGDDEVCVLNTFSENKNVYPYEQIQSIAQSKRFFLIYRSLSQCTVVSKETLQGGSEQEFLDFLADRNPKLQYKPLRTPRLSYIVKTIVLIIWAIGLCFALYRLPVVQDFIATRRPINDTMSMQEIADKLGDYGITPSSQAINAAENDYLSIFPEVPGVTYHPNCSKALLLLVYTGQEAFTYSGNKRIPVHTGVYWLNMKYKQGQYPYIAFSSGLQSLDPGVFQFTYFAEDMINFDESSGNGQPWITFVAQNQEYSMDGSMENFWIDMNLIEEIGNIFRTDSGEKQLFFAYDGGEGCLVFYNTESWAAEFEKATGIDLEPYAVSIDKGWLRR